MDGHDPKCATFRALPGRAAAHAAAFHSPAHAEGEPGRHAAGQTADPVADDPQNRPGQGRRAGRPAGRAPSSLDGASSVPPIHADETIVKPFSDVELLSYVHALESGGAADETTLIHGDLMLGTRNRQAFYRSGKQPLALSAREYTTLETLIRANGEFLSFDELLEKVCGTGIFEQRDIMDGTLYSLTRKMRRMGFFITQRGHRYRIR